VGDKETIQELKKEIRQLQSKVKFNKKPNRDEDRTLQIIDAVRERYKMHIDSGAEMTQKDHDIKALLRIIRNKVAMPKGKIHEEGEP
jgi:hypothetical protein